ncbi:MAG: AbrB/MazE/SpoVT family DNA-binding domain-containing protein [Nanoarchaeota archaeon]
MKRKLVKQGGSALTVTLPSAWAKRCGLKPGDEIDMEENGKTVIISAENQNTRAKKACMSLDGLNWTIINRYLEILYRTGIEEITLTYTKNTVPFYLYKKQVPIDQFLDQIIKRFIGLEVVSHTQGKIVIQKLVKAENLEKADVLKHRIYFLIKETLDEFKKGMGKDFKKFNETMYERHDNVVKFALHLSRIVHLSDKSEDEKTQTLAVIDSIHKTMDKLRHTSMRVAEMKKITPKIKSILSEIFAFYISQFDVILKKDYNLKDLDDMIKRRSDLVNKVNSEKLTPEEARVLSDCKILLDTFNEFTSYYAAMHLSEAME